MTEMLYMLNCYEKEFDGRITNIEQEEDSTLIELDKTLFYPRGGGQPYDTGKVIVNGKSFDVVEVFKKEGRVFHRIKPKSTELKIGDSVHGIIDWNRRHYFMRCHTAAHVLSAIINKETNALITGNNISEDKVRIDFNLENFDRDASKHYTEEANKVIKESHNVKLYLLPREEAFKIPALVKLKKELPATIKTIRIVEIEGVDTQACAGTHVKNTKEIGGIQIIKLENKGKNNRRVYFKLIDTND